MHTSKVLRQAIAAMAAAAVTLGAATAQGDFLHWQVGSGDLLDSNWHREFANQPDQAPSPGDELNIGTNGDVSFGGTFNAQVFRVGHPWVPDGRNLSGPGTYTQTAGSLTVANHMAIGIEHAGTVELTGSAALSVPVLHVGFNSPVSSTLTLRNSATVTASFMDIGRFALTPGGQPTAPGVVEIHDSASITLNNGDRLILGHFGNANTGTQSQGKLTMTGGALNLQSGASPFPDLIVGWDGIGEVDMSDGTMNVAGAMVLAVAHVAPDPGNNVAGFTSQGTMTQSGGTVNLRLDPSRPDNPLIIGQRGQGAYNLADGELNVHGHVWMGDWASATGEFNISGGTANIDGILRVGLQGDSAVTQTNGTVNTGALEIAHGALGAAGTYTISGGILDVGAHMIVGFADGDATFHVIGGGADISVTGNYFQDPAARLLVEPNSGSLSLIDVIGDAHFWAGTTLEADLGLNYSPGDFWDVLTAASVFDHGINFVALDPLGYGIDYRIVPGGNGDLLQVYVIPEPASLGLLGIAALMLLRRRVARV